MHSPSWVAVRERRLTAGSDQQLLARLRRGEAEALGNLYDRYGRLVFRLACTSQPAQAEAITEDVFGQLWTLGGKSALSAPLLGTLLNLTAQTVTRYQTADGHSASALWGQPVLPALAPFAQLPVFVFDVLVLTTLGRLPADEVAIILQADRALVHEGLASGLAALSASGSETEDRLAGALNHIPVGSPRRQESP